MSEIYDLKVAIANKILNSDGTVTDLSGKAVGTMVREYKMRPAIPNKFLNSDGTYSTLEDILKGTVNTDIFVPVDSLDSVTDPDPNKIYLVPNTDGSFDEYFYNSSNEWDKIGEVSIDLSNYPTTTEVQEMIDNSITDVLGGEY